MFKTFELQVFAPIRGAKLNRQLDYSTVLILYIKVCDTAMADPLLVPVAAKLLHKPAQSNQLESLTVLKNIFKRFG